MQPYTVTLGAASDLRAPRPAPNAVGIPQLQNALAVLSHGKFPKLSMRSFAALLITHTSEQSTTTTSIAQALNVPLGASSFAIDRLVAEKLVKRVSDKADRRVFHLRLTSSGRALCRNLVKAPNSGSHFE